MFEMVGYKVQTYVNKKEGLFFFALHLKPYVEFVLLIFLVSNIFSRMILPCLIYGMRKVPSTFVHLKFWLLFVLIMDVKHGFI